MALLTENLLNDYLLNEVRNSALIESLLEAGLSYREIARIAKCSHGSVHAQKKEFTARKSKEQQQKLDEIQKQITDNKSESPIDTMKSMNVSDDVIKQVQIKIEALACITISVQ